MYPELCKIGPVTIYSYGLMLVVAFLVAVALACRNAKASGIDAEIIFNLSFTAFVSGIIGARILYVLENLQYYLKNPLETILFNHGGLSWFGGLIAGSIAGVAYLKIKKVPVYTALDLLVAYVALAQALGRIGCFLNGCCFGKPWEYGLYFPSHQARLFPVQILSSVMLVAIFLVLRYLQRRPHQKGEVFYSYLFLYSLVRFLIEFLRADNPVVIWNLTLFQLLSIAVFFIALANLISLKTRR